MAQQLERDVEAEPREPVPVAMRIARAKTPAWSPCGTWSRDAQAPGPARAGRPARPQAPVRVSTRKACEPWAEAAGQARACDMAHAINPTGIGGNAEWVRRRRIETRARRRDERGRPEIPCGSCVTRQKKNEWPPTTQRIHTSSSHQRATRAGPQDGPRRKRKCAATQHHRKAPKSRQMNE